jgi:hypothetical protein
LGLEDAINLDAWVRKMIGPVPPQWWAAEVTHAMALLEAELGRRR